MPTYEYRCKDCHSEFDVQQSFTDDALTVCPTCGGALRKVFGSVGITFKGSGFYKTDSRVSASKGDSGESSGEKLSDKATEKVGAAKDGAAKSDGASGANGKDAAASSANGKGDGGKGGKEKSPTPASKSSSKSGAGS